MTSTGVDRELLAVLVALEPLDDRKWDFLNVRQRTFHADQMLEEAWSSGERIHLDVAASLWNTGTGDLGYFACALDGRHLQAVVDATALRAGHDLSSNIDLAVARIESGSRRPDPNRVDRPAPRLSRDRDVMTLPQPTRSVGLER